MHMMRAPTKAAQSRCAIRGWLTYRNVLMCDIEKVLPSSHAPRAVLLASDPKCHRRSRRLSDGEGMLSLFTGRHISTSQPFKSLPRKFFSSYWRVYPRVIYFPDVQRAFRMELRLQFSEQRDVWMGHYTL
jgi:hypothetical protein